MTVLSYNKYLYLKSLFKMNSKTEIELNNFFIFNSLYGNCEGEEFKKILYYYPNTDHIDTQIKNTGLVEAIIQFTNTFKPSCPVSSLHTQKKRQLYFQPEENFWVVMTLTVPYVSKSKEGVNTTEYLEEDIQDNIFEAVLKQTYLTYRLFSGTFTSTVEKIDVTALKAKLEHFYKPYINTLKLQNCDIWNVFNGIQFLPLDKQSFLSVQCFINNLECNYPLIQHTAFLYNDHLVWSGIEPDDMQVVYQYLISTLLPAQVGTELQGGSMPRHQSPFAILHHGRFITGPSNLKLAKTVGKVPKVHLFSEDKPKVYYLVVYRALSASICLFVDASVELTLDVFKELDEFIGPQVTTIVSVIADYCTKQVQIPSNLSDNTPRFIYFNKLNLAYKSTVHLDNKQIGNLAVTKDSVKIMAEINSKKALLEYAGETIMKTMNDYWVIGKVSNLREFYVAIQQKNASLIDISDEVKRLSENELKGIFFHWV